MRTPASHLLSYVTPTLKKLDLHFREGDTAMSLDRLATCPNLELEEFTFSAFEESSHTYDGLHHLLSTQRRLKVLNLVLRHDWIPTKFSITDSIHLPELHALRITWPNVGTEDQVIRDLTHLVITCPGIRSFELVYCSSGPLFPMLQPCLGWNLVHLRLGPYGGIVATIQSEDLIRMGQAWPNMQSLFLTDMCILPLSLFPLLSETFPVVKSLQVRIECDAIQSEVRRLLHLTTLRIGGTLKEGEAESVAAALACLCPPRSELTVEQYTPWRLGVDLDEERRLNRRTWASVVSLSTLR